MTPQELEAMVVLVMNERDRPHPHHAQVWAVLVCEDCQTILRQCKATRMARDARGVLDHDYDEQRRTSHAA